MLRALIFALKTALLVALAVWIADRPGSVRIEWMDYVFTVQMGLFLILALAALTLSIFVYRVFQAFVEFPRSMRRYLELRRTEKGYKALTCGLAAVAAGDEAGARLQAHRAGKFLPAGMGLSLLLQAQAARLQGREEDAEKIFAALAENPTAGFLGLRGLLQSSLDKKDYAQASLHARRALQRHPRQPWILKLAYDLEIRLRRWEEAKRVLARAEKSGAISAYQAASDRIAIIMAQAEEAARTGLDADELRHLRLAHRFHPYFPPASLALARRYAREKKLRLAARTIERTWRKNPHPDLASFWNELMPPRLTAKALGRMIWHERLTRINPHSAESWIALARVALEEGLWGEARKHLEKAETIAPSAALYRLWMELERRAPGNPRFIEVLRDKIEQRRLERRWVCRDTGAVYAAWSPIAEPHGAFNTIEWDFPHGSAAAITASPVGDALIDAPRYAAS